MSHRLAGERAGRFLSALVALVSFVVLALTVSQSHGSALSSGDVFPALKLKEVESDSVVEVRDLIAGKVGAVVFMATTCGVCKRELLALKEISSRQPSLAVIAVSVDNAPGGKIAAYKGKHGLDFKFLSDPDLEAGNVFGFRFTPGMVLTDRNGRVVLLKGGFIDEEKDSLEKTIDELAR